MQRMTCVFTLLIGLLMAAAAIAQRNPAPSSLTGTSGAPAASPTPASLHPAFLVSETQLRQAFDAAEVRGEKKQAINPGEMKFVNVVVLNPLGGTETLQLRILFTTPIDQVRIKGFSFGLVAKTRTPEDRKAFEDVSIKRAINGMNQVSFRVFLQQPKTQDASIPAIHFKLLAPGGNLIDPIEEPTSFLEPDKDLIGAVAMAQDGQALIFPVSSGGVPIITNEMTQLTLSVLINDEPTQLVFKLS